MSLKKFKTAILGVSLICSLNAQDFKKLLESFKNEQYWKTCSLCEKNLKEYKKNSEFLNFCALSCLRANQLEDMARFASLLKKTKKDRENSIYFMTILYQKELLFHAVLDNKNISFVNIPKTNYILSDIFYKFVKKNFIKSKNAYIFKDDKKKDISYKLSVEKIDGEKKLFLRTFQGKVLVKTRIY